MNVKMFGKIGLALVVLILSNVACGTFGAESVAPTQAVEIVSVATVEPTVEPTAEPTVKVPETPDEETQYLNNLMQATTGYGVAFHEISALFTAASEDSTLFYSEEWQGEVFTVAASVISISVDVKALNAPDRFNECHSAFIDAGDHFELAMIQLINGVKEGNYDLISQATDNILLGNEDVEKATVLMNELSK